MNRRRATLVTTVAVGLAVILSACGDSDQDGAGGSGTHSMPSSSPSASPATSMPADVNEQDATFASNMVVHHREAIEMAEMASGKAQSPEVQELATKIKAAQTPEIEMLSGWLEDWGMEPPAAGAGMDHGSAPMPGAMDPAEMEQLGTMKGAEFDEMFLTMMIEHHQGAVAMAEQEVASGKNTDVKSFAQKVIDDQTKEITEMQKLLG